MQATVTLFSHIKMVHFSKVVQFGSVLYRIVWRVSTVSCTLTWLTEYKPDGGTLQRDSYFTETTNQQTAACLAPAFRLWSVCLASQGCHKKVVWICFWQWIQLLCQSYWLMRICDITEKTFKDELIALWVCNLKCNCEKYGKPYVNIALLFFNTLNCKHK